VITGHTCIRIAATQPFFLTKALGSGPFDGFVTLHHLELPEPILGWTDLYPFRMDEYTRIFRSCGYDEPPCAILLRSALAIAYEDMDTTTLAQFMAHGMPGWTAPFSLFARGCGRLPLLEEIQFTGGSLSDAHVTAFLTALPPTMPRLTCLSLSGVGFGAASFECLADVLKAGLAPALKTLDLSGGARHRRLCDTGATALGAALASGALPALVKVDLQNSSVTSIGLTSIADGLIAAPEPPHLMELNIMDSSVGDDGVAALAAASASHKIQSQNVRRTAVGRAGANSLLAAGIRVDSSRLTFPVDLSNFVPRQV
jgi:hypothetical protein